MLGKAVTNESLVKTRAPLQHRSTYEYELVHAVDHLAAKEPDVSPRRPKTKLEERGDVGTHRRCFESNKHNYITKRKRKWCKDCHFLVKQPDFSPSRLHFSDCWPSSSIAMVNICFRTLRAAMASSLVNTFKNVGRLQKVWQVSDLSGWRQRGGVF